MKLDCAVQHCLVVACEGALSKINKNLRPVSMRAVPLGTMYSSTTLIHSSPLIFRPGSTKCNEAAMSTVPMMPETITPRVVAVCDAFNRNCVSSSPRASIFEVLRDRQILGSEELKLSGSWRLLAHSSSQEGNQPRKLPWSVK